MDLGLQKYNLLNSKWIILIIALISFGINTNQELWKKKAVISHDVISYYAYLPAQFIEKDITLSFLDDTSSQKKQSTGIYWPNITPDGKKIIKTSMGMAILYSPFFFIAHAVAEPLGYTPDGFSEPYQYAVQFSGLLYLILGFYFLREILLRHFQDKVVAALLFLMFIATNLLCYSTLQSAYSHQYSFFLFALLIYITAQWIEKPNLKHAVFLGISLGMIFLVRPVNIYFGLILITYKTSSMAELKNRFQLFISNFKFVLVSIAAAFLVISPQLIYWKFITGHFFFNSYLDESFFFNNPHLIECLFGFRKGWLIYTPIMLTVFPGIYFLTRKNPWTYSVILILSIQLLLVASWWCWWFGGSFGLRPMIDIYPILVFPIAAYLEWVFKQTSKVKITNSIILTSFCLLNCFQTIQFHYNIIHYDSMTAKAYANRFFILTRSEANKSYLTRPDYEAAKKGIEASVPFEGE